MAYINSLVLESGLMCVENIRVHTYSLDFFMT